jgi:hypothetical protein
MDFSHNSVTHNEFMYPGKPVSTEMGSRGNNSQVRRYHQFLEQYKNAQQPNMMLTADSRTKSVQDFTLRHERSQGISSVNLTSKNEPTRAH